MRYLTMMAALAVVGCSNPTDPTRALPSKAHLDAGGSTAPADKGSCNPNDPDTSPGNLKHCAPGKAPGNSTSPGES